MFLHKLSYLLSYLIFLSLLNTNNVTFLADTHKIKWNLITLISINVRPIFNFFIEYRILISSHSIVTFQPYVTI